MADNQIRIAILGTRGVPARYGGYETFAEELGARLSKQGVRVTVYCEGIADAGSLREYKGINLEYVRAQAWGPLGTLIFDAASVIRARKGFDVVYMLGYSASPLCFLPRLFGASVWINMDGVEWARRKWSWAARAFILIVGHIAMYAANRIIADADAMAVVLKQRFGRVPNCTTIAYGADLPDAVPDADRLARHGLREKEYYIVVCRAEPENHVIEIVEGFLQSDSTKVLAVVSNVDPRSPYGKKLLAIASSPRVKLLGAIYDKPQVAALRFFAFAYMHGHSVGGTNPSLLEAMANGNPVIAHDNPFNREVAADGGLYFQDAPAIPALIKALESDERVPRKLGDASKHRAATHYSWDKITGQYLDLLKKSCEPRRGRIK